MPKSQIVPKSLTDKYQEITAITDQFCNRFLNDEYAEIIRNAVASLMPWEWSIFFLMQVKRRILVLERCRETSLSTFETL